MCESAKRLMANPVMPTRVFFPTVVFEYLIIEIIKKSPAVDL